MAAGTIALIAGTVLLSGALICLTLVRRKRIAAVMDEFARRKPSAGFVSEHEQLMVAIGSLSVADHSMTLAVEQVRGFAPTVPPPDSYYSSAEALRKQMADTIKGDLSGLIIGTVDVTLAEMLYHAGYPHYQLLEHALHGVYEHLSLNPEEFLHTISPFLATVGDPVHLGKEVVELLSQGLHHHVLEHGASQVGEHVAHAGEASLGHLGDAAATAAGGSALENVLGHIPLITLTRSTVLSVKRFSEGKLSGGKAVEHVACDVAGTGLGGVAGTFLIPIPFVGTAIGAFLGRVATNHFKGRDYRRAQTAYQEAHNTVQANELAGERETYRGYRAKAQQVSINYSAQCGRVFLPSEAPEVIASVALLKLSSGKELQEMRTRMEEDARAVQSKLDRSWMSRVIGLDVTDEVARLTKMQTEEAVAEAATRFTSLQAVGPAMQAFELALRIPVIPGGPFVHALKRVSEELPNGAKTQLKAFVRWSTQAAVMRQAGLQSLIDTINMESQRQADRLKPHIDNLNLLAQTVQREADALGR